MGWEWESGDGSTCERCAVPRGSGDGEGDEEGVWGANKPARTGTKNSASAKIGALVSTLAVDDGGGGSTATKYMAKELVKEKKLKQRESELSQGGGNEVKKRVKAKKDELRDLAFGGGL